MNMPIIVRLATKADLSNRSAAVALRDFEPLMTAVGQTSVIRLCRLDVRFARKRTRLGDL
jgi:hypothetical protein